MKKFISTIGLTFALITVFSVFEITGVFPPIGNYGTEYPGNTGLTMPGSGAEPAEIFALETTQTQATAEPAAAETQAQSEPLEETLNSKENEPMNDMLLVFWHGVAAVLIGEIVALAIITSCLRSVIKRKSKESEETK